MEHYDFTKPGTNKPFLVVPEKWILLNKISPFGVDFEFYNLFYA